MLKTETKQMPLLHSVYTTVKVSLLHSKGTPYNDNGGVLYQINPLYESMSSSETANFR